MYLSIDIGGTFIKYALMTRAGAIIHKNKKPAPKTNLTNFLNALFSIIEEQDDKDEIKGIAISCPGIVDVETGIIYHGGSFPFLHEVNILEIIQKKYQKNVSIENDAKCAAMAEMWLGSVKGVKDAVVLVLGTGVGGGIILGGKVRRGITMSAGEVSYIIRDVDPDTKQASLFGNYCSAVEMVRQIAGTKQLENLTDGEAVFEFINNQDEEATAIFDKYCLQLAAQILNLQYIIDPERFAIGGGISAQPVLLERINWAIQELKQHNPILHMANPQVVTCHFQNDANLYGALYHFLSAMEKR